MPNGFGWFERMPAWGRALVVVAVATAISTWLILTWLPNPLAVAVADHIKESNTQTLLLRRICESVAKTPYAAGRCWGDPSP